MTALSAVPLAGNLLTGKTLQGVLLGAAEEGAVEFEGASSVVWEKTADGIGTATITITTNNAISPNVSVKWWKEGDSEPTDYTELPAVLSLVDAKVAGKAIATTRASTAYGHQYDTYRSAANDTPRVTGRRWTGAAWVMDDGAGNAINPTRRIFGAILHEAVPARKASTAYLVGDIIWNRDALGGAWWAVCSAITTGTTGSGVIQLSNIIGATTADGGVTWKTGGRYSPRLGLLAEPATTQLLAGSFAVDTNVSANWAKAANATRVGSTTSSIAGETAYRYSINGNSSVIRAVNTIAVGSGEYLCSDILFRYETAPSSDRVQIAFNQGSVLSSVVYTVSTRTVFSTSGVVPVAHGLYYDGGWYRLWMIAKAPDASWTAITPAVYPAGASGTPTCTIDIAAFYAAKTIYPFQPISGATTKAVETTSVPITALLRDCIVNQGTLFCTVQVGHDHNLNADTTAKGIIGLRAGAMANASTLAIRKAVSGAATNNLNIVNYREEGLGGMANSTPITAELFDIVAIALRWNKADDTRSLWARNITTGVDWLKSSSTLDTDMVSATLADIDFFKSDSYGPIRVRNLALFPWVLSDTDIETLAGIGAYRNRDIPT